MENAPEKKEKLETLRQSIEALRKEKDRLASQKCDTCRHFILYRSEFYAGVWGYCDAHDRNVRKDQPRYAWCRYEVKE